MLLVFWFWEWFSALEIGQPALCRTENGFRDDTPLLEQREVTFCGRLLHVVQNQIKYCDRYAMLKLSGKPASYPSGPNLTLP